MRLRKGQKEFIDFSAPVPLGYMAARAKAIELREANGTVFTWATISEVLRIYHGFDRSGRWWRNELHGDVASRSRGGCFSCAGDREAA